MVINPTCLATRTRSCECHCQELIPLPSSLNPPPLLTIDLPSAVNWADAQRRVVKSYREWVRSAPEIQQMYSLNMPISALRTKMREEFEKHRYVANLQTVDILLFKSHAEYQVRF